MKNAFALTAAFMAVEWVGGWWANSLALMADAAHMLADSGGLLLALAAQWIAHRPRTPRMSYGYHRAEILGALFSALLIWLLAGILIYEAFQRFFAPPEVDAPVMMGVAALGLGVNVACAFILRPARGESLNARGAYLHVLGDLAGSVAALLAGSVIWTTGWRLADPLVTLALAALVLFSAWRLLREAVGVLMESAPEGIDPARVQGELSVLPGVAAVHDLHIWAVSSGRPALSVHLVSESSQETLRAARTLLRERHGIAHTTIQVEHPREFDSSSCADCG